MIDTENWGYNMELTLDQIQEWKDKIDNMSHLEMARMWRFSSVDHPVFSERYSLFKYFDSRFKRLGGMTSKVSKAL